MKSNKLGYRYPFGWPLRDKLGLELAKRSPSSAFAFFTSALIIYFTKFGSVVYAQSIRTAAICLVVVSLGRYIFSKKIIKAEKFNQKHFKLLQAFIILNPIFWSVITSLVLIENKMQGVATSTAIFITCAFMVGSAVSLSAYKYLGYFFQASMFTPMMIISFVYAAKGDGEAGYGLSLLFGFLMVYCFKLLGLTRSDLIAAIKFEENLIESQAQVLHTSRLASLGEMAAGLAHEINNPLFIIQGYSETIKKLANSNQEADKAKLPEAVEKMRGAIARAHR